MDTAETARALQRAEQASDGTGPSPGWLLRAGLASCLGTAIALRAARLGLALRRLEVTASGRPDARGLLGDGPVGPHLA